MNCSYSVASTRLKIAYYNSDSDNYQGCGPTIRVIVPHKPNESVLNVTAELMSCQKDSWPAANPHLHLSRRPTRSSLGFASRRTRGRGGLAQRECGAYSAPHLDANALRPLWREVGGFGNRSQAPGALWPSLRVHLKAAKLGSKHPITSFIAISFTLNV